MTRMLVGPGQARNQAHKAGFPARAALAVGILTSVGFAVTQEEPEVPEIPDSLKTVEVPLPENLDEFIKDAHLAKVLGKAWFWDVNVGGDGKVACATCHYHAGTDNRERNTVNPMADGDIDLAPDFDALLDNRYFVVPENNDVDDVVGSQGVEARSFVSINEGNPVDTGNINPSPVFGHSRQVTGRNTPTVINAVFNFRSFWDGRAENCFNGVDNSGFRNEDARVRCVNSEGEIEFVKVELEDSSLGSQAVGPPNNDVEMSWMGRTFPELGKKLLSLQPLSQQKVHKRDSKLGPYFNKPRGLNVSYEYLIKNAIQDKWWDSDETFDKHGNLDPLGEFSLMEANFSLIWGLAQMMYMSTLVSDDAPFDRWREGSGDISDAAKRGLDIFMNEGKCIACHEGPEFTSASVEAISHSELEGVIEHMAMGDGIVGFYDNGFYNIGVRPVAEDLGIGGVDAWDQPLSFTRLAQEGLAQSMDFCGDSIEDLTPNHNIGPFDRVAVDAAFKVPTMRNILLTGPYFHTGRYADITQVIDFYITAGDSLTLRDSDGHKIGDTTGSGDLGQGGEDGVISADEMRGSNLPPDIERLELDRSDVEDLIAFLETLTDHRVLWEKAPFDHPEIDLPNGKIIQKVGAEGRGPLGPLQPFFRRDND